MGGGGGGGEISICLSGIWLGPVWLLKRSLKSEKFDGLWKHQNVPALQKKYQSLHSVEVGHNMEEECCAHVVVGWREEEYAHNKCVGY